MASSRGFHGRSPIRSRSRRLVAWDGGPFATKSAITSVGKSVWTTGVALDKDEESTIVRIRGQIIVLLELATAAGDGFAGAIGIGLATTQAFAAGSASLPGPGTDPDWGGWIWHSYFYTFGVAAQSQGADVPRNAMADLRIPIDSKAMRKMDSNMTLFGVTETQTEMGTAGMSYVADTRVLVKLP